jgi:hypothetical protein
MESTKETKIDATHRLEREGRWEEANDFKEKIRQQFRADGMSRKEAVEKSWESMLAAFPPLEDGQVLVKEPIDEKLLPAGKVAADVNRDVLWVYENIDRDSVSQCDAPSAGAWSMLQHARRYRVWFYGTAMSCVMQRKRPQSDDDSGDSTDQINIKELFGTKGRSDPDGIDMLELIKKRRTEK